MWVYNLLLVILITLLIYYQYLLSQKRILTEHYVANSVIDSYDKYKRYIDNEQDRNDQLEGRLRTNDYTQMYQNQYDNFSRLYEDTKSLSGNINERATKLRTKVQEHNSKIENDKKNFIDYHRNKLIKGFKDNIDASFANPKGNMEKSIDRVINKNIDPMFNEYVAQLPENNYVKDETDKLYKKTIEYGDVRLKGMTLGFNKNVDEVVNTVIKDKIKTLPSLDLSKSHGVLVRMFDNNRPNTIGRMTREYIIPSISYYMTQNDQPLLSTASSQVSKIGQNRYLEFIGTIKLPSDVSTLRFSVESGSGVKFYFGNQIQIDSYDNRGYPRVSKSREIQVIPNEKIPYQLKVYEGSNSVNTHIILKWSIDNKPFAVIPSDYFFLPDLSDA